MYVYLMQRIVGTILRKRQDKLAGHCGSGHILLYCKYYVVLLYFFVLHCTSYKV